MAQESAEPYLPGIDVEALVAIDVHTHAETDGCGHYSLPQELRAGADKYFGVDGGGSRTRVLVADEQGREIVSVEGGGSAVRPGEAERSADVIAALVRDALAASDMTHVTPKVVCVGVAGVGRDPGAREPGCGRGGRGPRRRDGRAR